MKKILLTILIIFILIFPVYASTSGDNYNEWKNLYYEHKSYQDTYTTQLFNNISNNNQYIEESDFFKLKYIYKDVYNDESDTQIQNRMEHDFKTADANGDGKVTLAEFKPIILPLYEYHGVTQDHYEFFKETDRNHDGHIDLDEFSEVYYLFTEDSFWDGYSIEEICVVEFESANGNSDDYLNFTEFSESMGL